MDDVLVDFLRNMDIAQTQLHIPSGDVMAIYDAAARYMKDGQTLIILGGKESAIELQEASLPK